jgi:hypothetical protein
LRLFKATKEGDEDFRRFANDFHQLYSRDEREKTAERFRFARLSSIPRRPIPAAENDGEDSFLSSPTTSASAPVLMVHCEDRSRGQKGI